MKYLKSLNAVLRNFLNTENKLYGKLFHYIKYIVGLLGCQVAALHPMAGLLRKMKFVLQDL